MAILRGNKRTHGFTLTEVLIGVALIGLISVGGIGAFQLLNQITNYGEESLAVRNVVSLVYERMRYVDICTQALGASSGLNSSVTATSLSDKNEPIQIRIPMLRAGVDRDQDILQAGTILPGSKLKVADLRLVNVEQVSAATYIANIQLSVTSSKDRQFKPVIVTGLQFDLNSSGTGVGSCSGSSSVVVADLCAEMKCVWETSPIPHCKCATVSSACPVGEYPIAFGPTGPTCQALGGSCAANQYVVGARLGGAICKPLPTPIPAVNGVCGGANGRTFADAATAAAAGLCAAGSPSVASLSGAGPWSWACGGSRGGITSSCSASMIATPTAACFCMWSSSYGTGSSAWGWAIAPATSATECSLHTVYSTDSAQVCSWTSPTCVSSPTCQSTTGWLVSGEVFPTIYSNVATCESGWENYSSTATRRCAGCYDGTPVIKFQRFQVRTCP